MKNRSLMASPREEVRPIPSTGGRICHALEQNIQPSTIEKLHNSLVTADRDYVEAFLNFLYRVRRRFGNDVFRTFLSFMKSYEIGEITGSEMYMEIVKLFGEEEDLVTFFTSVVPVSYIPRKKRKIDDQVEDRRRPVKKAKAKKVTHKERRIMSSDDKLEEKLGYVDMNISNLRSTYKNASKLLRNLFQGNLSPSDVSFKEHFTALNLAFIRKLSGSKQQLLVENNPIAAIQDVIRRLDNKEEALRKDRDKIIKRWNEIRQSRRWR